MRNNKEIVLVLLVIIITLVLLTVSRCKVLENELYVKFLNENAYFEISKHKADREIIRAFKRIKKTSLVRYVGETSNCLLYKNDSNVLRLLQIKNKQLENVLYRPRFSYTIDGKYVHFFFEDELLDFAGGIMIRLNLYVDTNEKNLYYIPINSTTSKYESIVRIDKIEELKLQNPDFEIEYVSCR